MMRPIDVAIVGGGPGGAAAANAVHRAAPHLRVHVFERVADLNRTGSVVGVSPNGLAAVEAISSECLAAVNRALVPKPALARYSHQGQLEILASQPSTLKLALWCNIQNGLLELLPPGTLHLGHDLQSLDVTDPDGVVLQFRDHAPVRASIVVGCDGNQSKVRQALFGDGPPNYVGAAAWRGITPVPDAWPFPDDRYMWFGQMPAGHALVCDLADGTLAWHVSTPWGPDRLEELGDGRYVRGGLGKGSVEDRKQRCLAAMEPVFAPALLDMVRCTDAGAITEHGMFYRDPEACQVWGSGPVTLLGDAAHLGATPLGQGMNMALEDAVELGRAIGEHGATEAALRQYERVRVARATTVQGGSVGIAKSRLVDEKAMTEYAWIQQNPWLFSYKPAPLMVHA